ncbi:putative cytochrome c oxidase subunit 2 [Rhodovastum atsumiense]|uniref:Cytochrome c oxidase subunit 2 n=1 Tax=Rhodovastum atsumiense TaxID=504468 RepID=A0A5M6IXY3_9PROT|nr:cytochrome c oxidase subunit II [Rhodovastum atsumiense]KAA5613210.1 cytochrome c oxidase subunit II [Rhodovastum atsumiense]CAH2600637.1 putative cytochrome c oxidase subunit 2 [Rhodovastum atsumiense]
MHRIRRRIAALGLMTIGAFIAPADLFAAAPQPWQTGMQPPASPVQAGINSLHDLVLVIITAITLLVAVLLAWVLFRYNARRHPTPSQTSHNTVLEVAWTVLPVLILVVIAIPSFRLIYFQDRTVQADLTVKVTGHQWYWEYTYPDNGGLNFSSYMVPDDQLKPGQLRLLDVDNQVVVPVGKNVRILTTSADVIHSFYIPSLGVQRYAIPGRTIETWVRVDRPGVYYGECNQICGTNHSMMPIAVRGVPPAEFTSWLEQAKTQFSDTTPAPVPAPGQRLAEAAPQ